MSFATGLEGFVMLLPCCRRDRARTTTAPVEEPRWFEWGYFTDGGRPKGWYILIRLPSYLMKPKWYAMGEPAWHQRCLLFEEPIPAGAGGWKVIDLECE